MFALILASVLIASAFGCGKPAIEPLNTRVVNGEEAKPHSWPWQVSLQYQSGSSWYHTCGGSIIAENWVMTAAHCISPLVQNYRVQVGKHELYIYEDFSTTISAQKIIVHEEWNFLCKSQGPGHGQFQRPLARSIQSWYYRNDIALIKLSKPVTLSDTVQLGCLPPAEIFLPHGLPCFLTGWGRLSTEGPYPERLQQVKLLIVGNETCCRNYFWGGNINFSMICAGGDGIVAGCSGDFGGPLNCQKYDGTWEVHGIASFVSDLGCNIKNKPTVFTRVSFFTDWIDKVMMNN